MHTGCPLTEGPHQSSDPWGPARSVTQPGYSAMVGNSPHLNQHGPFTAINPQDRLVSSAFYCYTLYPPFIFYHEHTQVYKRLQYHLALGRLILNSNYLREHEIKGSVHEMHVMM